MKFLINDTFAANLGVLRNKSGLTQQALTDKMQLLGSTLSRSSYAKIECGLSNIKVTDLAALKEIYHIGYDDFFQGITVIENDDES